jgi:antitoxin ParD1/3/4
VIRASLRLLEEEESKIVALRHAIQEGSDSEFAESFYFDEHLAKLKSEKRKNG